MANGPKAHVLGPGTLNIGKVGDKIDLSCQVTECRVTWDNDREDDIYTLCGGTLAGSMTFTATLEATLLQDYEANGVIDFTWKHKGEAFPVEFLPNKKGAKIEGNVTITPIEVGGELRKVNTSDVEWQFVGEPTYTPMTGGGA